MGLRKNGFFIGNCELLFRVRFSLTLLLISNVSRFKVYSISFVNYKGESMVGVAEAVGKALIKSGMPPLQKAGIILGSSVISGLAQSRISIMNRNMINDTDLNSSSSIDVTLNVSKFITDSISSPLHELLVNFKLLSYVCLSLFYIIVIQLLLKLYFKDEINLKNFYMLNANWRININY